ncbi:hypothetical protein LIER_16497 [Lithospermum erythrorhizon]|uniref:SWIM-type domain-containing protein n=1 Tax=Lithospermum erythrorhizon TaxID=34254 RepID=A0AAV3QBD1_LITER
MAKMKTLDSNSYDWFSDKDPGQWSRAFFTTSVKCDVLLINMCEVFNAFILDARDKPILTMMSMVKDLVMVRMQTNRDKAEKWEGRLCPKPRAKLLKSIQDASGCMPMKCDRIHFQVYSESTSNQCVMNLEKRQCSCRRWQLNGILCKHACASMILIGENVEEYVDDCYTIDTYKKVYIHAIKPMTEEEIWSTTNECTRGPSRINECSKF